MPKNTSNARFGQVLSEIWLPEVFGSLNSCGRAQTGMSKVQALMHTHSKSKELWKAMFHLDLV